MSFLESEIRDNSILRRDLEELVRERFGYTLNRPDSPRDIVKLLRLDELEREIHWRRAKLFFDGRSLQWIESGEVLCTMPKTWNRKFAIRAAAASILGLFAVLMLVEIWGAWTAPEEYPFRSQGPAAAMWAYQSQTNYLLSCIAFLLGCSLAIWALLAQTRSTLLRWLCGLPVLITWALMAFDGTRLDL